MSYRRGGVWTYGLGVWMSGVVLAYVPSLQTPPTASDVALLSPSLSMRPLTATKRPSETLFAGGYPWRLPEPIDWFRPPPVQATPNPRWERSFAPEPFLRSSRIHLPGVPSFSRQDTPPSLCVPLPKSAVEYLLADATLGGSQRTAIKGILDRRRQLHEELSAQIKHDLEWIERLAPNGQINEKNTARVLKVLHAHLQKRQEIEAHTLDALRGALTEAQWNRFQKWFEAHPAVSLDGTR